MSAEPRVRLGEDEGVVVVHHAEVRDGEDVGDAERRADVAGAGAQRELEREPRIS